MKKGAQIRAKVDWIDNSEKSNKSFLNLEKVDKLRKQLNKLNLIIQSLLE